MGNVCDKPKHTRTLDQAPAKPATPAAAQNSSGSALNSGHSSKQVKDKKVRDVYKVGKTLGTGGFSVVKLVTHRETGEQFACKVMSLPPPGAAATANDNTREDIFKEIDILIGLEHANVIFLKEYFEEGNKVYLIMELLQGGELLDAVLEKGHYSEDDARICFVQIMNGIMYLHSKGIVHRDLKLENLLLVAPKDTSRIKIADFGLAKNQNLGLTTVCGTPQYVAPEIIKGGRDVKYGPACDLWSMGVILFILLGGYPPFYDESEPRLFDKIRKGKYDFNDKVWEPISSQAKDLIKSLLVVDPNKRLTCEEVMAHPWIKAGEQPHSEKANLLGTTKRMRNSMRVRGADATKPPPDLLDNLEEASATEGSEVPAGSVGKQ